MSRDDKFLSSAKLALSVRQLRSTVNAALLESEPIAVIGVGCRFPGGVQSTEDYWRLMSNGVDAVKEVPTDRWKADDYYEPDLSAAGKMNGRWGGFLDNVDCFDPVFFGISPREATNMDPQQRLTLEVAWEALWDSGRAPEHMAGSRTGVFVAIYNTDYSRLLLGEESSINSHTCAGTAHSMASGRVAYLLDLHGPAVSVDTACSSSLVSVHLAVQSLRSRDCDMAIAGGVSMKLTPEHYLCLSKLSMLSPDGHCHTFDAAANGFVPGEGCGLVVLKRLSDALADGDPIRGVIRGSAVNQDGRTNSLTAPNGVAQRRLIRAALSNARVQPSDIGYVETHGTGTALGDPIEVEALAEVIGEGAEPCVLGAIKSSIGHLEAASGIAGFIKALLVLEKEEIPPNLHFNGLNPHISLDGTRLEIPVARRPWKRGTKPRLAGVSSFGFTGTNAHLILEESPRIPVSSGAPSAPRLPVLAISARTPQSLEAFATRYAEYLAGPGSEQPITEICRSAAIRRAHYKERIAVTGATHDELRARLLLAANGATSFGVARARATEVPPVAFVFSGQGSQWPRMGAQLMDDEPVFRRSMQTIDGIVKEHAGWSVIEVVQARKPETMLHRTEYAQPAIVAVEIALAELWKSWGIIPSGVLGHSVGEIVAAHVAGVLDLDTAMRIAVVRGRLMDGATGRGRMATVALSSAAVAAELGLASDAVSIAAMNGPTSTVISGDPEQVQKLLYEWQAKGISARELPVDYAFHSIQMEPFQYALAKELGDVTVSSPQIDLFSTVTGGMVSPDDYSAEYWGRNVRQPVMFETAMRQALSSGIRCFLEVGPHAVLKSAIDECVDGSDAGTVSSLRKGKDERTSLMAAVAHLYTLGQPVNWTAVLGLSRTAVSLPAYPYERRRYWVAPKHSLTQTEASREHVQEMPFAGARMESPALQGSVWQTSISAADVLVRGHRISGSVVFPLAGFIELVCSAIGWGTSGITLEELRIEQALHLTNDTIPVQTILKEGRFEVFSLTHGVWTKHVQGKFSMGTQPPVVAAFPSASGAIDNFYAQMSNASLEYGPEYRTVRLLDAHKGEARSVVSLEDKHSFCTLHPALLDGCLQTFTAACGSDGNLYMPVALERFELYRSGTSEVRSRLTIRGDGMVADFMLVESTGGAVAHGQGLQFRQIRSERTAYELRWKLQDSHAERRFTGTVAVMGENAFLVAALGRHGVVCSSTVKSASSVVYVAGQNGLHEWPEIVRQTAASTADLWLITRNAHAVQPFDSCDGFDQMALWGVARTAALEYPALRCRRVDLDDSPDSEAALIDELLSPGEEVEIAFRHGKRFAASVSRMLAEQEHTPRRLAIAERGSLTGLRFESIPGRDPGTQEVEVEVLATALNFRDVMNALGAYPGDPGPLGLEFCGRVRRTGSAVEDCRPGDLVMGLGWGAFADTYTAKASLVRRVPSGMDAENAVTLPNAFATAHHCLIAIARLRCGDRVLIHSGAGGVGLMAVRIALNAGAEVFATAGSPEKRDYLRSLGVKHVFPSRTLDFSHMVLTATAGQGVDVVLNSLSGNFIDATFAAIADGGRFVEIGKTGIWNAARVSNLGRCIEYSVVDIGVLIDQMPEVVGGYLDELCRLVEAGAIVPLPTHTFPFPEAERAFRFMAQAKHTGKIVLRHQTLGGFRTEGKWLLTGGLGALGLETAKWLVSRGASALVLAGRSAPSNVTEGVIEELRAAGAVVEHRRLDVGNADAVVAMLASAGPLTGIVHLAGVLDDGVLAHQTSDRFERVWRPKAAGAWNLHEATNGLRHFILFSSAAALLGSPGQSNYAAANAYLDGLAAWRSAQGLPALSVQWGAWMEGGMAAQVEASGRRRTMSLLRPMTSSECLDMLESVIGRQSNAAILSADWEAWHAVPARSRTPVSLGSAARDQQSNAPPQSLVKALAALAPARRRKTALDYVRQEAARILDLGEAYPIGEHEPLMKLGLDSLMALEMRNTLSRVFERPLSATLLYDHPTLAALVDFLTNHNADVAAVSSALPRDEIFSMISALSDEEAEELLAQELSTGSGS